MVEGVLGCPVCQVEREVRGGVLYWSANPGGSAVEAVPLQRPSAEMDDDATARVGALLGFGESTMPFVLTGQSTVAAAGLLAMADAALLLLDPPDDAASAFTTVIRGAPRVPLGARSTRGVLLSGAWANDAKVLTAVDSLVDGGRLVAPASVALPAGVRELARDAQQWVAERVGGGVPIPLRRAGR